MQGKKMAMNTVGFILLSRRIPTGIHDTFLMTPFVIWVTALKYKESL